MNRLTEFWNDIVAGIDPQFAGEVAIFCAFLGWAVFSLFFCYVYIRNLWPRISAMDFAVHLFLIFGGVLFPPIWLYFVINGTIAFPFDKNLIISWYFFVAAFPIFWVSVEDLVQNYQKWQRGGKSGKRIQYRAFIGFLIIKTEVMSVTRDKHNMLIGLIYNMANLTGILTKAIFNDGDQLFANFRINAGKSVPDSTKTASANDNHPTGLDRPTG